MTITRFNRSVLSATLALGLATNANAQAAPAEPLTLAMPAMPLGDALRQFARACGCNLVVDDRLVVGRTAPALSGRMRPDEALQRLLAGSGLSSRTVDGTIVIAQSSADAPADKSAQNRAGEEVLVTGTHVRGAPPTSPVITLTRKQIDEAGVTSVEALMRRLPQNLSAGVGQENFAVTDAGQDITQSGAGINLRGLGQRATLVLINGRRVAPSDTGSFVDVSLIPITAIERVEVVTDGASAIYGSDAVGGVVNFILRNDFKGVEPVVQAGTTTDGGGRRLLAGVTAGTAWSHGHAVLSYEYRDDQPIKAKDRDFTVGLPDFWNLTPREKRHSLYATIRQDLSDNLTLDLSGNYSRRNTDRDFEDASLILIAADARARSYGGTAALQLRPGGPWLAEASASYFRSRTTEREIQAGKLFNRNATENNFREFAVKADGSLFDLPGGAAKLALGAGLRHERFTGLFASSVNVPTATNGSRTVSSAYGELNLPIVTARNKRPGLEELTFTAAGRLEHYERIGSTFNPKLGALWSPVAGLAFRGSYGTSFRAPLLSESFGVYNIFLFPVAILYEDPSHATSGVGAALIGSDPNVKPERSRSLSLGVEVTPPSIPRLRFSANYYRINFTNRIALPSTSPSIIGDPAFAPIVTLKPPVAAVADLFAGAFQLLDFSGPGFTNGGATPADVVAVVDDRVSNTAESRTSGVDLLVHYDLELGGNAIGIEVNANKVFRFDDKLTSASPSVHTLNTPFNPVSFRARSGLSWRRGPVNWVAFLNYTGSYHDNRTPIVRPVRSFTTVDTGLALDGTATAVDWLKHVRIALNVENLFDARPPRLGPETGSSRGIGYDPVNASGQGRIVSVQVRSTW